MSSFLNPLIVSPTMNGRDWRLFKDFSYRVGKPYSGVHIKIPKGFITDFASIPHFLFLLPYWAKFNKAPIIHDWLYHRHRVMGHKIDRKQADNIFLEAMLVEWQSKKKRHLIAYLEYFAVRLFGYLAWSKKSI